MPDGRAVAVKVQHLGIAAAVESDLENAGMLQGLVATLGPRQLNSREVFNEIKQRFREELDYELEGRRMEHFARVHEGDPQVRVTRLVRERSSRSVLTTELVTGKTFDEACAASEAERVAWAETMWRYVFKGNLVGGMFNADPHPGNYLFHDGGAVTFMDYGCVQEIPEATRAHATDLHRAACRGDEKAFATYVRKVLGSRPGKQEDLSIAYSRKCFEPLFASPYRITRDYAASLVKDMHAMGAEVRALDDHEVFAMPREMLFMNRLQFGFYSVLARLDVELDYRRVEESFMPAP